MQSRRAKKVTYHKKNDKLGSQITISYIVKISIMEIPHKKPNIIIRTKKTCVLAFALLNANFASFFSFSLLINWEKVKEMSFNMPSQ